MRVCRLLSVLAWLLPALAASAQPDLARPEDHPGGILLVVTDKSGLVTNDSPLYLASNHVGWNPGDPSMKLTGRSDLRWQIQLPGPVGDPPLEFKFTRGSWERCEVAADLQDISNRTLKPMDLSGVPAETPVVIELTVERFADERKGADAPQPKDEADRALHVTGHAVRVQVAGGAGAAIGTQRDVIVWLPPGYDDPANAERRYPVLYMQDGQNVFDYRAPTPGEWHADETATELIEGGKIEPIIIAAIPNSGSNRLVEYLPADGLRVRGQGDAYLEWVFREVVPRVERVVRAEPDPKLRGIGGSSLGGLLALRAGQRYPGVFGRVLAESPSLHVLGNRFDQTLFGDLRTWRPRTWIAVGGAELDGGDGGHEASTALAEAAVDLAAKLKVLHGGDDGVRFELVAGAAHNEDAWAARFGDALRFLYPADR